MDFLDGIDVPDWPSWESAVVAALGEGKYRKLTKNLGDGVEAAPLYPTGSSQSFPKPYCRGGAWKIGQRYYHPDPNRLAKILDEDLQGGVESLIFRVSDNFEKGCNLFDKDVLNRAFGGVYLEAVTLGFEVGYGFAEFVTSVSSYMKERGYQPDAVNPQVFWSPFHRKDTPAQLKELAPLFEEAEYFQRLLVFSGEPVYGGGGSGCHELGVVLSSLLETLKLTTDLGLAPELVLGKSQIKLALGTDLFYDTAKIRACKLMVAQLLAEIGVGVGVEQIPIIGETSLRHYSKTDPWVNILRGVVAATSGGLGGVDSLIVAPFDVVFGQPSSLANRVSRNIQHLLLAETKIHQVEDPGAGATYVESLTESIGKAGWGYFQKIEQAGGLSKSLDTGVIQEDVSRGRSALERQLACGKRPLTGTSEFPNPAEVWPHSEEVSSSQFKALPGQREAQCPPCYIPIFRESEVFEHLRLRGKKLPQDKGVYLMNIGDQASYAGRQTFAKNLLGIAGLEGHDGPGGDDPSGLLAAYSKGVGYPVVVLAGSDQDYDRFALGVLEQLKGAGVKLVLLAQNPRDKREAYEAAGADGFIFLGCNKVEVLDEVLGVCEVGL